MDSIRKVVLIFGTRPEAIKMCPLYLELKSRNNLNVLCLITAQHRDMLDSVMKTFNVNADYDLNIMSMNQTLSEITSSILCKLIPILDTENPDLVLVHGDTTTAFAASLACFYKKITVGHVEAGMRSYNRYSPFPEEMNRRMISCISTLHFAATKSAKDNLLIEGISPNSIFLTGNTVIDALRLVTQKYDKLSINNRLDNIDFKNKRVILLTCHRRENWGLPMSEIFTAVKRCLALYEDVEFIFPIHKNPIVREIYNKVDIQSNRMHVIEPLDYTEFIYLMKRCFIILTDSGGIQEEAPYFGIPVIVIRDVTERVEAVKSGTVILAGTKEEVVYQALVRLLDNKNIYQNMSKSINPYGDGYACSRIADVITHEFDHSQKQYSEYIVDD